MWSKDKKLNLTREVTDILLIGIVIHVQNEKFDILELQYNDRQKNHTNS